jgi:SAM-dependent methyltransferase
MVMARDYSYSRQFFEARSAGSLKSASVVVPLVTELVRPRSVVDVGCGVGTWLWQFKNHGADRILGMDGDYIDPSSLLIPSDCFRAVDLNHPVASEETFDLAVCLEVAEHLPKAGAERLIGFLCERAPVVLFSAAVPMQGGTHHVNEQWPEYWEALFARHGYERIDAIRKFIWKNSEVEWWYRQNTFLFVRRDCTGSYACLAECRADANDLVLVHKGVFEKHVWLPEVLKRLPARIMASAIRRVSRTSSRVSP